MDAGHEGGADATTDTHVGTPCKAAPPGTGCHRITSSGTCLYTSAASGAACKSAFDGGAGSEGPCPCKTTSELYGCCVTTHEAGAGDAGAEGGADAGTQTATCYYGVEAGAGGFPPANNCEMEAYENFPVMWVTSPP